VIARARRAVLAALALSLLGAGRETPPDHWTHELQVTLEPDSGTLRVSDRAVAGGGAAPRAPIDLRLAEALRVTALRINGSDRLDALTPSDAPAPPGLRFWTGPEVSPGDRLELAYEGALFDADVPRVSSEGAILPADAGWTPAFGAAPGLHSITVRTPAAWKVICPGRPDTAPSGVARFRAEGLTRGLTLAAGPWQTSTRARPGMALSAHLRERDADRSGALLDRAAAALDRLERVGGRFPWRRLDLVESPFASRASQPGIVLVPPDADPPHIARAVAGQWWGAFVSPADTSSDWTSALAAALAIDLWDDAASRERLRLAQALRAPGAGVERREARDILVFAQLRRAVGEETFAAALRDVGARFGSRTAGWPDLRSAFEAASGRDLGWLFDQWIAREGLPRVSIAEARAERHGGGYRVTGTIAQAGDPWRLAVPLAITTLAAADEPLVFVVESAGATAPFSVEVPARPVAMRLDPRMEIPREMLDMETPPCLQQTLASEKLLCVLPAAAFASPGHPYHALAQAVAAARPGTVVASDDELRETDLAGRSLIVLGRPDENRVARLFSEALRSTLEVSSTGFRLEGGSCAGAGCALMVSTRHPIDPAHHLTWFFGLAPQGAARAAHAVLERWDTWVIFREGVPSARSARPGDDPAALRLLVDLEPVTEDPREPLLAAALEAALDDAAQASVMEEALNGTSRAFTVSRLLPPHAAARPATVRLHRGGEVESFAGQAFAVPTASGVLEPSDSILVAPEDLAAMGAWPPPASVPSFEKHVILSLERPADDATPARFAAMLEGARRLGASALIVMRAEDGPSVHAPALKDAGAAGPLATLPLGGPPPSILVVSAGPELGEELLGRQAFARLATPPDRVPPGSRFSPWLLDLKVSVEAEVRAEEAPGSNIIAVLEGVDPARRGEAVVLLAPRGGPHRGALELLAAAARWGASSKRPMRALVTAAIDPAHGPIAGSRALAAQMDAAGLIPSAVVSLDLMASPGPASLLKLTAATPPLDVLARAAAREAGVPLAAWSGEDDRAALLAPFIARGVPVLGLGFPGPQAETRTRLARLVATVLAALAE
jgi:hypothetical protein